MRFLSRAQYPLFSSALLETAAPAAEMSFPAPAVVLQADRRTGRTMATKSEVRTGRLRVFIGYLPRAGSTGQSSCRTRGKDTLGPARRN